MGKGTEIFSVGPDGSALAQLTNSPGWDGDPAWSPDGIRIAFSSSRSEEGDRDILVMNADGSEVTTVVTGPGDQTQPSWSPDGTSLAYVSDERFAGSLAAPENVFLVNLDTGQSAVLGDYLVGEGKPIWSPDGTRIIFSARCTDCREYSTNIVSVSTDGRSKIDLTEIGNSDADPVLSPFGRTVLFIRYFDVDVFPYSEELWSVQVDGSGLQRIRSDLFGGSKPTISPDGLSVVLENYTCPGVLVCVLDVVTGLESKPVGDARPIEGSGLNMDSPDWGCCSGPALGVDDLARGRMDNTAAGVIAPTPPNLEVGLAMNANMNADGVTVKMSELWGGGFQNMIVEADSKLLMAGDNSGVHAHTNQWAPSSAGFESFKQSREVASIGVHPDGVQMWAATTGGVYYSNDEGSNWQQQRNSGQDPKFRGNNNPGNQPLFPNPPRSTGQLLVVNGGGNATKLYAASAEDGLWRSKDDGVNWVQIALDGHYLRAVVQHPTSGALYVASFGEKNNGNVTGGGIYEVCAPGTACAAPSGCGPNASECVVKKLTAGGELNKPEELVFDTQTDRLWCACGNKGVWRTAASDFDDWQDFSPAPNNNNDLKIDSDKYFWSAIDIGDFDGNQTLDVVAGAVVNGGPATEEALQWTPTNFVNWRDVIGDPDDPNNPKDLRNEPVCDTNVQWWAANPDNGPIRNNVLVGNGWDTGFIKFIDDSLYITGRSGAWRMSDGNDANTWLKGETPCAFVQGLGSTANRAIDAGPAGGTNNTVIIGNTDFDAISSTDGLNAVDDHSDDDGIVVHKISELTVGYDVDFNSSDATPYALIGAGNRDKVRVNEGHVYRAVGEQHNASSNGTPLLNWRVVGVGAATRANSADPTPKRYELAVVTELSFPGMGMNQAAASTNRGIWRKVGVNGDWIKRTNLIGKSPGDTNSTTIDTNFTRVPIEWGRDTSGYTNVVFLLDRETGIWRSNSSGNNWAQIWAPNNFAQHFPGTGSDADFVGFMALNPVDQKQLVFSSALGLYQINQATSCNSCSPTPISPPVGTLPDKLGPVGFSPDGHLVVSSRVEDAMDKAEIWVDDGAGLVIKVDDDPIFNSAAFALTDMAITANGIFFSLHVVKGSSWSVARYPKTHHGKDDLRRTSMRRFEIEWHLDDLEGHRCEDKKMVRSLCGPAGCPCHRIGWCVRAGRTVD